jgi:hypothetical protein
MDHPVTIRGQWLDLNYDCGEKTLPPYGRVPYRARYRNVTSLTIYVDMTRKVVAGILPAGRLTGKPTYPAHFVPRSQASCRH